MDRDDEDTDWMKSEVGEGELRGEEVGDFEEERSGWLDFKYFHKW